MKAVTQVIQLPIEALKEWPGNPRKNDHAVQAIADSIERFGMNVPVLINEENFLIAGNTRWKALKHLKDQGKIPAESTVPCLIASHLSPMEQKAFNIADNKLSTISQWDEELLKDALTELDANGISLDELGFTSGELEDLSLGVDGESGSGGIGSLSEKFMVPPFSVLNAREGWWQQRKKQWISMGIESEKGRKENLLGMSNTMLEPDPEKRAKMIVSEYDGGNDMSGSGTSIFDPTLCELAYRWFSPSGGVVLDPFSGGSVRGIVASKTGRQYVGNDLRNEQVEANRDQATRICSDPFPVWHCGDSQNIKTYFPDLRADFIFSCPPYADLEVYSDMPEDLSTMDYPEFISAYRKIIAESCSLLKQDRFACFVVGDVRHGKHGAYRNFVSDTIAAFRDAGLDLYNEAILITAVGTVALRAGKQFSASRKLGKSHQNVLVFVKGDPKEATKACGEVEICEIEEGGLEDRISADQ